ncbi:MAG TPA: AraC family transcriptional regulator [Trebonia sp.]|jgi:AraC-like DNA-binding protein|nr:AraC family transcriptional regulator [Trebonia sp.]
MDILAGELEQARARGAVFSVLGRREPWGLEFSGTRPLTAHILLAGAGVLEIPGSPGVAVAARDVVLVTAGTAYRLLGGSAAEAEPIGAARGRGSDDGPADAVILCGAYVLEGSIGGSLLRALPRVVHLPAPALVAAHSSAIDLLAAEAGSSGPGQQALLDRLLDLNLVYALRAWWARAEAEPPGWYRAAGDPFLGRVLDGLHARPAGAWSVPEMARLAGLSRAAFAARFTAVVGQSPGRYLTGLRMRLAEDALVRTDAPIARVAADSGYGNEYAFATAFRRHHGMPPGKWRAEHSQSQTNGATPMNQGRTARYR